MPHCTVTTSAGVPLPLNPPPRANLRLDYDTSFLEWSASFTASAPGRYTVLCNGVAETGYFQITDEPTSPRRWNVIGQRIAVICGLIAGSTIIAVNLLRRRRRRAP